MPRGFLGNPVTARRMTDNSFGREACHARTWRLACAFGATPLKPRLATIFPQMELLSLGHDACYASSLRSFLPASSPPSARAEDAPVHHHALSLIGEPKYPADFKQFDYVNPDAPKGGVVRMADIGSFDSLNPVLYKGEAAAGLGLVYRKPDGRQPR